MQLSLITCWNLRPTQGLLLVFASFRAVTFEPLKLHRYTRYFWKRLTKTHFLHCSAYLCHCDELLGKNSFFVWWKIGIFLQIAVGQNSNTLEELFHMRNVTYAHRIKRIIDKNDYFVREIRPRNQFGDVFIFWSLKYIFYQLKHTNIHKLQDWLLFVS